MHSSSAHLLLIIFGVIGLGFIAAPVKTFLKYKKMVPLMTIMFLAGALMLTVVAIAVFRS